jgi:hypothetical protein
MLGRHGCINNDDNNNNDNNIDNNTSIINIGTSG